MVVVVVVVVVMINNLLCYGYVCSSKRDMPVYSTCQRSSSIARRLSCVPGHEYVAPSGAHQLQQASYIALTSDHLK